MGKISAKSDYPSTLASASAGTAYTFAGKGFAHRHLPAADSIFVLTQAVSKGCKISLYPDASHTVLFFSVKGDEGKVYQLFIFDMDGRLIKQTEIRNKQTTVIRGIDNGAYLFDVFSDDIKIGSGQLTVR